MDQTFPFIHGRPSSLEFGVSKTIYFMSWRGIKSDEMQWIGIIFYLKSYLVWNFFFHIKSCTYWFVCLLKRVRTIKIFSLITRVIHELFTVHLVMIGGCFCSIFNKLICTTQSKLSKSKIDVIFFSKKC